MSDVPQNLSLVALARIQALEARPEAERFRARWLGGRTLDASEADSWAGGDEDSGSQSELDTATSDWSDRYGWTETDGRRFALSDVTPTLRPVEPSIQRSLRAPGGVTGALSERITLRCRPQATVSDVAAAYQHAQRAALSLTALAPRERTRPMTSPRRVDLAVMGARIYLNEFKSWPDARAAYNAEHTSEVSVRPDLTGGPDSTYESDDTQGRFRKDVRDSFRQATGMTLDFQPARTNRPPTVSLEMQEDGLRYQQAHGGGLRHESLDA